MEKKLLAVAFRKKSLICVIFLVLSVFSSLGFGETLCGISYFGGWTEADGTWAGGNRWCYPWISNLWLPDFPEREPLLGKYNTQESMDKEICAAAGNGVDFFKILWYNDIHRPNCGSMGDASLLNTSLDHFINSPESWRMKFVLEFCNTDCFSAYTDQEWLDCVAAWRPYLEHQSYLRVDGKLVIQLISFHQFWLNCGGDLATAQWRIAHLRNACENIWGIGEVMIGCGSSATSSSSGIQTQVGFEWQTIYGWVDFLPYDVNLYPYSALADEVRRERATHASDYLPYVPLVMEGWDARPWNSHGYTRPNFEKATHEEFEAELLAAKQAAESNPSYGLPGQPAISIYNWSEYGEGGYMSPTRGWGFSRLDSVRKVFGAPDAFAGYYLIHNDLSKKTLRVNNGSTSENDSVVQQSYSTGIADEESWWWNVVKLASGNYRIMNVKSGLGLTVLGDFLVQKTYQDTDPFAWTITEQPDGSLVISNVSSQLCAVPEGESGQENAKIVHQACGQTSSFKWCLVRPEKYGAGDEEAVLANRYLFDGNGDDAEGGVHGTLTTGGGTHIEAPLFTNDIPAGAVAGAPAQSMMVGMDYGNKKSGMSLNNTVLNSMTNAGSMSLWMKPHTTVAGQYNLRLPAGLTVLVEATDNVSVYHYPGGVQTRVGLGWGVTNGGWHHVAVTWDAARAETLIYVNGAPAIQEYDGVPDVGGVYSIRVGGHEMGDNPDFKAAQFDGQLYDLQFYDAALLASDVATLHANPGSAYISDSTNSAGFFTINLEFYDGKPRISVDPFVADGRNYTYEFAETLTTNTNWKVLGEMPTTNSFVDHMNATNDTHFYRVKANCNEL